MEKEPITLKACNLTFHEDNKYSFAIQTNTHMEMTSFAWEHRIGYLGEARFYDISSRDIENLAQSLMNLVKPIPNHQKEKLVLSNNKFKGIYAGKEFPEMLEVPQEGFKDSEVMPASISCWASSGKSEGACPQMPIGKP